MSKKLLFGNSNSKVINKWRSKIKNYPLTIDDDRIDSSAFAYIEEIYGNSIIDEIKNIEIEHSDALYHGYIKDDGDDTVSGDVGHFMSIRTGFIPVKDKAAVNVFIYEEISELFECMYIKTCAFYDINHNLINIYPYDEWGLYQRSITYAVENQVAYMKIAFSTPIAQSQINNMIYPDWIKIKVNFYDEVPSFPLSQGAIDETTGKFYPSSHAHHNLAVNTGMIDIREFNFTIQDILIPNISNVMLYAIYKYDKDFNYLGMELSNTGRRYNNYYAKEELVRYVMIEMVKSDFTPITPDEVRFNFYNKYDREFEPVQLYQGGIHDDRGNGEFTQEGEDWHIECVRTGYIDLIDNTVASINVVAPHKPHESGTYGVVISYVVEYDENMDYIGTINYDYKQYHSYNYVKKPGVRYIAVDFLDYGTVETGKPLHPEDVVVEIELSNAVVINSLEQGGLHSDGSEITSNESYYHEYIRTDFIDLQDHTTVLINLKSVKKDMQFGYIVMYDENKNKRFVFDLETVGIDNNISSYLYERDIDVRYIRFDMLNCDADAIEPTEDHVVVTLQYDPIPVIPLYQGHILNNGEGSISDSNHYYHDKYVRTDYIDIENYYSVTISSLVAPDHLISSIYFYDEHKNIISHQYYEETGINNNFYNFEYIRHKNVKYIMVDFCNYGGTIIGPEDVLVYMEFKEELHLTPELYQGDANTIIDPPSFVYDESTHNLVVRTGFIDLEGYNAVAIKVESENDDIHILSITECDSQKLEVRTRYFEGLHYADVYSYVKPDMLGVKYIMISFCNYHTNRAITTDELTVHIDTFTELEITPKFIEGLGIDGSGILSSEHDHCTTTDFIDVENIDSFTVRDVNGSEFVFSCIEEYDASGTVIGLVDVVNVSVNEYTYLKKNYNARYVRFDYVTPTTGVNIDLKMYIDNALEPKTRLYQGWCNAGTLTEDGDAYHNNYVRTDYIPFNTRHAISIELNEGYKVSGLYVFDKDLNLIQEDMVEDIDFPPNVVQKISQEYVMFDICSLDGESVEITPDDVDVTLYSIYSPSIMGSIMSSSFWTIPSTCTLTSTGGNVLQNTEMCICFISSDGQAPHMRIPEYLEDNIIHISATYISNVEIVIIDKYTGEEYMIFSENHTTYESLSHSCYLPRGGEYYLVLRPLKVNEIARVIMLEMMKINSAYNKKSKRIEKRNLFKPTNIKAISSVGEPQDDGMYRIDIRVCDNKFFFGRGGKKE